MKEYIIEKIKKIRVIRGYTQKEIAAVLGMSRQRYARMESNDTPITIEIIEQLAAFYEISTNEITNVPQEKQSLELLFRHNYSDLNLDFVIKEIKTIVNEYQHQIELSKNHQ